MVRLNQLERNLLKKGINKASDAVVKKAGDKIGNILRKRSSDAGRSRLIKTTPAASKTTPSAA